MADWFKVLLSLSLSGSVLLLAVMGLCRLLRHKVSKRWQYYIWLVVILRLLVPYAPEWNLVGAVFQRASAPSPSAAEAAPAQQGSLPAPQAQAPAEGGAPAHDSPQPPGSEVAAGQTTTSLLDFPALAEYLWIPWLVAAVALLLRKITAYQSFATYITAGKTEIDDPALLNRFGELCEEMGVGRHIELHQNPLAASPLLSGILRPCIVLPSAGIPDKEFSYIIRHELVHYKRGDIYYKWLAQVALCIHWFNPLAHWMVAELNRCCELSCDEAVIRPLDEAGKRQYGDTLLESLKNPGSYKASLASITLNETVSQLKERLLSIMNYEKKPVWLVACSVSLSILLCVASFFLGAYVGRNSATADQLTPPPAVQETGGGDIQGDEPPLPSQDGGEEPPLPAESAAGSAPESSSSQPVYSAANGGAISDDINAISINLKCSYVQIVQGDSYRVDVSPKLTGHVSWQVQDKTLVVADDFGDSFSLQDWNAGDYTVRVTVPKDNRSYETLSVKSGFGGLSISGLTMNTAEFSGEGPVDIERVKAGSMRLSHSFGQVNMSNSTVTGTIEYTGEQSITMEKVSCGSLLMEMAFGTATLTDCSVYTAFSFKGDAEKVFTGMEAGSMTITSTFGATTLDNSAVNGALYHEGANLTVSDVIAGSMEFRQEYGSIVVRDCAIGDGLTLHNDGGSADIEAGIKGDIILNAGAYGSIDLRNTAAKRSEYSVEATGFSQVGGFVNASYIIDGQVFTSDYRYTPSAPYKLGIYSTRDYGNCATISFMEE